MKIFYIINIISPMIVQLRRKSSMIMFSIIPGVLLTALLALTARAAVSLVPHELIGAGVFALFVGIALHPWAARLSIVHEGIGFTAKRLLRLAIVCMGVSLSLPQVMEVGAFSLLVMFFTLATAFGGGYLLGRVLGLDWRLSGLISAGTGICGGSAIAAIAPVIDAKPQYIAYALSATFIFDVLMVVLFPLMGRALSMSDLGFGLWAGTAINDTSSVVAAGYTYSEAAGNLAIVVKLTRTLSIVPAVLVFSIVQLRQRRREAGRSAGETATLSLSAVFPWFVLVFLAVVVLNSVGAVPARIGPGIAGTGKFLMVMALGAIGLKTDAAHLARSGFKPMLHGLIISTAVVMVSLLVQMMLHQV